MRLNYSVYSLSIVLVFFINIDDIYFNKNSEEFSIHFVESLILNRKTLLEYDNADRIFMIATVHTTLMIPSVKVKKVI